MKKKVDITVHPLTPFVEKWWQGLSRRGRERVLRQYPARTPVLEIFKSQCWSNKVFRDKYCVGLGSQLKDFSRAVSDSILETRLMEDLVEEAKQKKEQKERISAEFFGMKEGKRKSALTRQQDQPGARKLSL